MIIEDKPNRNINNWWANRVKNFFEDQRSTWPLLSDNYRKLSGVKTRFLDFERVRVQLQNNPARMISTSADVSKEAVTNRKCFLCIEDLPKEQNGLRYDKNFVILCNPYPIFEEHFTIVNRKHTEQTLIGHFEDMLNLSRDLGKYYSIFYNGPKCGASAPDHMHFQAALKNKTPLENEIDKLSEDKEIFVLSNSKIEIRFFENHLRNFFVIESGIKGELLYAFKIFIKAYKKISLPKEEPMMNLVMSHSYEKWRVIFFPRSKHRPTQYFSSGNNKMLISPAAVDLSGLIILPREEDYEKINNDDVVNIFKQVSLNKEYFEYLKKKLKDVF